MDTRAVTSSDRKFLELQHQYRGLVAQLRSRRFVEIVNMLPSTRFRSGASDWMLNARAAIPSSQYRSLLEWVAEINSSQLGNLGHIPIAYEELAGIYGHAPAVSFENEILWITERLRLETPRIEIFLQSIAPLQSAVLSGDYEEALALLTQIQSSLGVSLWSVQLRLALEQLAGGLERQKRYSAEVRAVYQQGLLGFTAYHTSVRNEDRTTLTNFLESIDARIERHSKYDAATKTYMRYRLMFNFPATEIELADILRIEQSHGIVDLYETFVAVLQEFGRSSSGSPIGSLIAEALSSLSINDFRLRNIVQLLRPPSTPHPYSRDHRVSDLLFEGKVKAAFEAANAPLKRQSADPWDYIYAGFALSHASRKRQAKAEKHIGIVPLIARAQRRGESSSEAWSQLSKILLNLRGLPVANGLLEFCRQMHRTAPDQPWQPWLIGLSSPLRGPEDLPWSLGCFIDPDDSTVTSQVWYEAACPSNRRSYAAVLGRVAGHIFRTNHTLAAEELSASGEGWPEPLREIHALLTLHSLYALGERQKVIELISREGARGAVRSSLMPISATLKDYTWADYKLTTRSLASPIALHLLWSGAESGLVASQMRFSTGQALRRAGVTRPSNLADCTLSATQDELVYFLRYLCVPEILDLTRMFSGSREIMEERQAIYSLLIEIDPAERELYENSIFFIANELALDEGRWIVDSTRIHVDSEALVRWAVRSLAEDYERYRDLASVSVAEPQSFKDALEELGLHLSQRTSFVANSEADAVLLSILRRLGEEFLTNATFGLDFYLSKRIRHQSFIGLIRGPIEFSNLITTRVSEGGEYHENTIWVNRFEARSRKEIDASLKKFSSRFDETLGRAKDTYFHLRSAERPQGMLLLALEDRLILLARKIIQLDFSFREFLGVATSILWAALEPSLATIRAFILDELKVDLARHFDVVRAEVREHAENDPAFLEFDAAMGKGSAEVQVKLDEAAHWFVHADTLKHQRLFTLEQMLKISIDTALKTQRGYAPQISQTTEGELSLYAPDLVFVHDVVFVGLGNAHKHSGLKAPKIDISARYREEDVQISLEIVSDCKPSNRAEKNRQAREAREAIDTGSYLPRTRKEGESGFAKLAAVVGQSTNNRLDFGFTDDGRFRLTVSYALRFLNPEADHAE